MTCIRIVILIYVCMESSVSRHDAGRRGAQAGAGLTRRAHGRGARGARQGRGHECATLALGARPRRAVDQQAVHLVHSACFWPSLTQYCS